MPTMVCVETEYSVEYSVFPIKLHSSIAPSVCSLAPSPMMTNEAHIT